MIFNNAKAFDKLKKNILHGDYKRIEAETGITSPHLSIIFREKKCSIDKFNKILICVNKLKIERKQLAKNVK